MSKWNKRTSIGTPGNVKIIAAEFGHNTTETDTTIDLPDNAVVMDVFIDVETADTGITLDVGLLSTESGGDADGFLDGISVASTGLVHPAITVTSGSSEDYFSATTYGAFLADFTAGSDNAGDVGTFARKYHPTDSVDAKSISYTASAGADTAAGTIYFVIAELL